MAESLKGKVAVITGVGSGFGKATAELFAKADQVSLVLIDYNETGPRMHRRHLQGIRLESNCPGWRCDQDRNLRSWLSRKRSMLLARLIFSSTTPAAPQGGADRGDG